MADISKVTIKDQIYDVKDAKARKWATEALTAAGVNNETNTYQLGSFKVDSNGLLSANGELLPMQPLYVGAYKFTENEQYITNPSTQLYMLYPGSIGEEYNTTNLTATYGPFVAIKNDVLNLPSNKWYMLVAEIYNYHIGWTPIFRAFLKDLNGNDSVGAICPEVCGIGTGTYYLTFPIYITDEYKYFGFYAENNNRHIKIRSVSLYAARELLSDSYYTERGYYNVASPHSKIFNLRSSESNVNYMKYATPGISTENPAEHPILLRDYDNGHIYVASVNSGVHSINIEAYISNAIVDSIPTKISQLEDDKHFIPNYADGFGDCTAVDDMDVAIVAQRYLMIKSVLDSDGELSDGTDDAYISVQSPISMSECNIRNLADPENDGDATNKKYVDNAVKHKVSKTDNAIGGVDVDLSKIPYYTSAYQEEGESTLYPTYDRFGSRWNYINDRYYLGARLFDKGDTVALSIQGTETYSNIYIEVRGVNGTVSYYTSPTGSVSIPLTTLTAPIWISADFGYSFTLQITDYNAGSNGLMSSTDKTKLDRMPKIVENEYGRLVITMDDGTKRTISFKDDGTITWS